MTGERAARGIPAELQDEAICVYNLLGGDKVMKRPFRSALDAHDLIVEGLPSKSLLFLVENVQVLSTGDVLERAVGISLRAIQRSKAEGKKRVLSVEQGSRAWRFAGILARASDLLGGQAAAEVWILEPAIGLENRRPIDLLASAAGAEAVEDFLTRMEYGVYT